MTLRTVCLVVGCTILLAPPLEGQDSPRTLAPMRLFVEQDTGTFLERMSPADLSVTIAGQRRSVHVIDQPRLPATWVLLVDVSLSVNRGGRLDERIMAHDFAAIVRGLREGFVDRLPAGDRLLVVRFAGQQIWRLGPITADRAQQHAAIGALADPVAVGLAIGPSPIWDAVAAAARMIEDTQAPRAIVLVTDGHATANRLSMEEAAAEAAARGVSVFAMHEPFWSGGRIDEQRGPGARFLRPLAAVTGGLFRVNDSHARAGWQDPLPRYDHFIDAMRRQHVSHVDVTGLAPGRYPLEIRASDERLTLHAPAWIWVP